MKGLVFILGMMSVMSFGFAVEVDNLDCNQLNNDGGVEGKGTVVETVVTDQKKPATQINK
jgi:hypothetical protein